MPWLRYTLASILAVSALCAAECGGPPNALDILTAAITDLNVWSTLVAQGAIPSTAPLPGQGPACGGDEAARSSTTITVTTTDPSWSGTSSITHTPSNTQDPVTVEVIVPPTTLIRQVAGPTTGTSTIAVIQTVVAGDGKLVLQLQGFKFLDVLASTTTFTYSQTNDVHYLTTEAVTVFGNMPFMGPPHYLPITRTAHHASSVISSESTAVYIPTTMTGGDYAHVTLSGEVGDGVALAAAPSTFSSEGETLKFTATGPRWNTDPLPEVTMPSVGAAGGQLTYAPDGANAAGSVWGVNADGRTITVSCGPATSILATPGMTVMALCPMPTGFD